ncbi:MAG: carboxypeptidase regulatory-like domain-containing protein [Flavipsychrobacter sp.]|nr:carboxypeptidase regulatory-like domain-containing protein [Flavipsychrobacter sp.]
MKIKFSVGPLLLLSWLAILSAQGQGLADRSDKVLGDRKSDFQNKDNWAFGLGIGTSFSLKNKEAGLFRGNGLATKMFGKYYFGSVGLSVATGILTGSINENSLNKFMVERGLSRDRVNLTKGNALNGFLAIGPSFRFGHKLYINADLQGGLFFNTPGVVAVNMKHDGSTMYRFESVSKKYSPGFSGSIIINYPLGPATHFFINADYLYSRTSLQLTDVKNGYDVATGLSRDLSMMVAGIGISKSFGSRPGTSAKSTVPYFNKIPNVTVQTQPNRVDTTPATLQSNTGIISGNIYWQQVKATGIVTNEMEAEMADIRKPEGAVADQQIASPGLYIRKTGRGASKKGSPLYEDHGNSGNNPLYNAGLKKGENPLYQGSGNSGNNPLYGSKSEGNGGGICGNTSHFLVTLKDRQSGIIVAKTIADSCGNFWFANVPDGMYSLHVKGFTIATTRHEVIIMDEGKHTVGGTLQVGNAQLIIALNTQPGPGTFQYAKKTEGESDPGRKVEVICAEQVAGQPIEGVIVKGGKYPGGPIRTVQTDEYGKFELSGLKKGTYYITSEIPFNVSVRIYVEAQDFNTTRNNRERGQ